MSERNGIFSSGGWMLAAVLGFSSGVAQAQAVCSAGASSADLPRVAPSSDFVSVGDGVVAHLKTGLIWKRCAEGQQWDGSTCQGSPMMVPWASALQWSMYYAFDMGASDWRVPNRKELESIVEYCGHSPAINQQEFPGTAPVRYWTSTTYTETPSRAWEVYFGDGYTGTSDKSTQYHAVRLVRTAPEGLLLAQQRIQIDVASELFVGVSAAVSAQSTAGLPVSIASETASVCNLADGMVTPLAEGICRLKASQPGDAATYPAEQTVDLPVARRSQLITLAGIPSPFEPGQAANLSATATSGLPVTLRSGSEPVCAVSGLAVTALAAGTCLVRADQDGDSRFLPAPTASVSFPVTTPDGGGGGQEPTPPDEIGYTMRLGAGWHLLGNSLAQPIRVAELFADPKIVESVWKWSPEEQRWAFFAPRLKPTPLSAYARAHRLTVLSEIHPGEAYWVKVLRDHDFGEQRGLPAQPALGEFAPGWHLVTVGQARKIDELVAELNQPRPVSVGASNASKSVHSVWAWHQAKGRMLFFAPELAAMAAPERQAYFDAKNLLDFAAEQILVGAGRGFWLHIKE